MGAEKPEEVSNFQKDKSIIFIKFKRYKEIMSLKKINIAIAGATGYVGLDLVKFYLLIPR